MTDTKKYFWLKLKEDFFDDKTIKYLRKLPDGNAIVIIFLKMQLKSLKTEGFIKYDGIMPTCEDELALILDEDVNLVRFTIGALERVGAVERWDNDTLYISALQPLIGSESAVAERVRRHRAKKKAQESGQALPEPEETPELPAPEVPALQSNTDETKCNTEIEIEKEIDIDKEINIQTDLTEREREQVELLADLFAGWEINDYQILYIFSLISERLPFSLDANLRDIKVYDNLRNLIKMAKADQVQYIYRWLVKVIPNVDIN